MSPLGVRRCVAAILVYHSVADVAVDPFGITVAPADFERHMQILAARFAPLGLREFADGLAQGELPQRAVVVTFDDGYANNLSVALPSLRAHGVPATLFVATGYIGSAHEFWWDQVEHLASSARDGDRAPVLELSIDAAILRADMTDPVAAAREISLWLQGQPAGSVERGLEQLRDWAGVEGPPAARPTHRPMTLPELREVAASGQFEIGAHTRNHLRLGAQTENVQHDEIAGSRDDLRSWLGEAPASFAYPFGNPDHDYTPASVAAVRELGFELGLSGCPGLADPSRSRFELPRWFVNTPGAEFERWLANRFRALPMRAASKLAAAARRAPH